MTYRNDFTLTAELLAQVREQGLEILPDLIRIVLNAAMQTERSEYLQVRKGKKTYPVRSLKYDYLIGGKIFCERNHKWGSKTNRSKRNRKGELIRRKTPVRVYYSTQNHKDIVSPNCPRHIGAIKAEDIVWKKICEAIDQPDYLLGQARNIVVQIREHQGSLKNDRVRIQNEIDMVLT